MLNIISSSFLAAPHVTVTLCSAEEYNRERIQISLRLKQAVLLITESEHAYHCPEQHTADGKVLAGGPLSLFFYLWSVYMWRLPRSRCAGSASHSASQSLLPWARRPPAAEAGSTRSEGIIRESVWDGECVHVLSLTHISEHFFHICTCETLPSFIKRLYVLNVTTLRPVLRRARLYIKSSGTE